MSEPREIEGKLEELRITPDDVRESLDWLESSANERDRDLAAQHTEAVVRYIGGLTMSRAGLLTALESLAAKLDEIVDDESYLGVFILAHNHGLPYRGPTWAGELDAARAAIARATATGTDRGES